MFSDYIEKYVKYQNENKFNNANNLLFLFLNQKYYMFYNEKSALNALPIRFKHNSIFDKNGDLYYYIAFGDDQKKIIFEKLKKFDITILDHKMHVIDINQNKSENKSHNIYKKIFNPTKKFSFISNIGVMQNAYSLFGGHIHNIGKNIFRPILTTDFAYPLIDCCKIYKFSEHDNLQLNLSPQPEAKLEKSHKIKSSLVCDFLHKVKSEDHPIICFKTQSEVSEKSIKSNKSSIGVSIDELENAHKCESPGNSSPKDTDQHISIDELEHIASNLQPLEKKCINEVTKMINSKKICSENDCSKLLPDEHIVVINNLEIKNIIKRSLSGEKIYDSNYDRSNKKNFSKTMSQLLLDEYDII